MEEKDGGNNKQTKQKQKEENQKDGKESCSICRDGNQ
jgi:hypothetical protein